MGVCGKEGKGDRERKKGRVATEGSSHGYRSLSTFYRSFRTALREGLRTAAIGVSSFFREREVSGIGSRYLSIHKGCQSLIVSLYHCPQT